MAGLPVVRTGNVALDRFLEAVREYIETSKGGGNPQSKDRVLRVSDLPAVIQLATAAVEKAPAKVFTQDEMEKFARDLGNTRVFKSLTSAGGALDGVIDGYPRETLADVRAAAGNSTAGVVTEAIVATTDTQAIAAQVTTVTARLDDFDGTATIEEAYLALADKTNGLEAQYTIKVRAGGAIAGIGLAATSSGEAGATSAVIISADKFAVVPAGATGLTGAKVPFSIDTGTGKINFTADVAIDGSLLVSGTVSADLITSGNLALTGGNLTTYGGLVYATGNAGSGNGTIEAQTSGETGVKGWSTAVNGQGVLGYASASGGTGVHGWSLSGPGLRCTGGFRWGSYTWSAPSGTGTLYLRNDGSWATPTATADWATITGKPSTFPPESHTHPYTTSTDVNNAIAANNVVATAAVQSYYASGRTITIPGVGSWSGCSIT
jgi:hypothetical protein